MTFLLFFDFQMPPLSFLLLLVLSALSSSKSSYFLLVSCQSSQNRAPATAILTLTNSNGDPIPGPPLFAGVFTSASPYQQAFGQAVYALSNTTSSSDNSSGLDNFGCSKYVNPSLPADFVAIVSVNPRCPVDEQIQIAIASGARALILRNNISDTPTLLTRRAQEKPIVSLLVSDSTGDLLIKQANTFVLISPNNSSADSSQTNVQTMGSSASRELSPGSIAFIVLGTVAIILIISGMWIIFYLVQRARRVEERERYAEIMERLTKKAIAKTKCRKLKMGDKELVGNEVCIICMEEFKINDVIRRLPCSHYFHKSEIDIWLHANQSCPICKENLLKVFELDIQSSSGFFRRILERFHLVPTPVEITEVILAQSESRRGTVHSRRDTVFSVQTAHAGGPESLYSGTRRNTFFGEHYSDLPQHHAVATAADTLNETEENELEQVHQAAAPRRRLTFFGEKEEDLHLPPSELQQSDKGTSDHQENKQPDAVTVAVRAGADAVGDKGDLTELPV